MLTEQIIALLQQYKEKPYMPIWGEIFVLLYNVKREADDHNRETEVYAIGPTIVTYRPDIKKFSCDLGEIKINLSLEELTDSLVKGAMVPKRTAGM